MQACNLEVFELYDFFRCVQINFFGLRWASWRKTRALLLDKHVQSKVKPSSYTPKPFEWRKGGQICNLQHFKNMQLQGLQKDHVIFYHDKDPKHNEYYILDWLIAQMYFQWASSRRNPIAKVTCGRKFKLFCTIQRLM